MARQIQRMVTRARVVRGYYDIRAQADNAAADAQRCRDACADSDAEFHTGRQAAYLSALNTLDEILKEG